MSGRVLEAFAVALATGLGQGVAEASERIMMRPHGVGHFVALGLVVGGWIGLKIGKRAC
jgi:hypothetical protein